MDERETTIEAVRAVLQAEPHLRWAYLFGSIVRGNSFRDVDVAVMPAATMPEGLVHWGQIVARLEAAAGRRIDLADLSVAELPFVGPLLEERLVIVDHERDRRHSWEAETTSRWLDFKPCWLEAERIRALAMQVRLQGAG